MDDNLSPYDMEVSHSEGILSSQLVDDSDFFIEALHETNPHEQLLDRGRVQQKPPITGKRSIDQVYGKEPTPRQPAKKRGEREIFLAPFIISRNLHQDLVTFSYSC